MAVANRADEVAPLTPLRSPATNGGYFPSGTAWDRDVASAPVDPQSPAVLGWLAANGGWGSGGLRIDSSMQVLTANDAAPLLDFQQTTDFFGPDCDQVAVPVPWGGALQGERGYACAGDGDCHLIVVHTPTRRLYEMWRANITGVVFLGGCLAVWDLTRRYGAVGRGDQCGSADAAGFPIAPLLLSADEVAAGAIHHAVRLTLPKELIRHGVFVRPATHAGEYSGPDRAVPYGARFRLRADYPLATLPNAGARIVARALQRHGMLLADSGPITLTAASDRFTTAQWSGLLGPRDLQALRVGDFQMIDAGVRVPHTGDCQRVP